MDLKPLTADFTASPQIDPGDIAEIARLGYTVVINNRPDGEAPGQPASAVLKAACEQQGLAYVHIPMLGVAASADDIASMARILEAGRGPVVAFCRSGTRSTFRWALARAAHETPKTLIDAARSGGFDLSGLTPELKARYAAEPRF